METPLLSVAEVARLLNISATAVREMAHSGELPAIAAGPKGGRIRFEPGDVEAYKRRCRIIPTPQVAQQRRRLAIETGGAEFLRSLGWKG